MARRKSYNTAEMSFDEVAESLKHNDVIMIPMGSNEKHGAHCVFGTDTMTTMGVVRIAAELAQTLYSPVIPVGYSPHHMGEMGMGSGTMTLSGATYRAVVYDLAMSMIYHGFNKIVFVTHHGSNSKVVERNPPQNSLRDRVLYLLVQDSHGAKLFYRGKHFGRPPGGNARAGMPENWKQAPSGHGMKP